MKAHSRTVLTAPKARAILAGVVMGRRAPPGDVLEELALLAGTAGVEEVGRFVQVVRRPDPGSLLGRGKVEEIARAVRRLKANVVIFDNDLTPAQVRNLEKALGCGVVDRSELILGIFARRARTKQAKLQVELARLEYMLPRLKRMWTHLERQVGGIGLRAGAGERQIETDRRKIRRRIRDLTGKIEHVKSRRRRMVGARSGRFTVSLVGYTNAGKSTLMRALTGAPVRIEDKLFATLDTKTRRLAGGAGRILVSDTVGFIRDLPHHLVASFHATLEEARTADLLLHVVDVSRSEREEQMRVAEEVLGEIGAGSVPVIVVLNKTDLLPDRKELGLLRERLGQAVATSAVTGEGVELLRRKIVEQARRGALPVRLKVPASESGVLGFLARNALSLSHMPVEDETLEVKATLRPADYRRLLEGNGRVEVIEGPDGDT